MPKPKEIDWKKYQRPNKKEWISDIILIAFACLAYSIIWDGMVGDSKIETYNVGIIILHCVSASILFFFFYIPMRIPYIIEEYSQIETKAGKLRFFLSFLVLLIPALIYKI